MYEPLIERKIPQGCSGQPPGTGATYYERTTHAVGVIAPQGHTSCLVSVHSLNVIIAQFLAYLLGTWRRAKSGNVDAWTSRPKLATV
jgi:hypothetical protein